MQSFTLSAEQKEMVWSAIQQLDEINRLNDTLGISELADIMSKSLTGECNDEMLRKMANHMDWSVLGEGIFRMIDEIYGKRLDELIFGNDQSDEQPGDV